MATVKKGSTEHTIRRIVAMQLKHFATKYGMTTRLGKEGVEGYNRGTKQWILLYRHM